MEDKTLVRLFVQELAAQLNGFLPAGKQHETAYFTHMSADSEYAVWGPEETILGITVGWGPGANTVVNPIAVTLRFTQNPLCPLLGTEFRTDPCTREIAWNKAPKGSEYEQLPYLPKQDAEHLHNVVMEWVKARAKKREELVESKKEYQNRSRANLRLELMARDARMVLLSEAANKLGAQGYLIMECIPPSDLTAVKLQVQIKKDGEPGVWGTIHPDRIVFHISPQAPLEKVGEVLEKLKAC